MNEFKMIGKEGLQDLRVTLKFGDVVKNHNQLKTNQQLEGIFVELIKGGDLMRLTNGKGYFWEVGFNRLSKLEVLINQNKEL